MIYWLSHSPSLLDVFQFVAPMLLILVLCSAYAEANGEGQVMIRVRFSDWYMYTIKAMNINQVAI